MEVNRAQRVLLLDNYDSYTFNLFQLLAEVNGGVCTHPSLIPLSSRSDSRAWPPAVG